MKSRPLSTLILLPLLLVSCASHLAPSSVAPRYTAASRASTPLGSRVLVKTGSLRIEVSDVKNATTQAKTIIKNHKGLIKSIISSNDTYTSCNLELSVPKTSLLDTMDQLATLGKVTSRNVKIEDITNQWIDLQAKIKNMRALRNRLRNLLTQSKTVKETLEVEKELTRVQSELDSIEGKITAMRNHISYSKFTLSIRQKTIPGPIGAVGKGVWWGIKKLFVIK